jgi:hypothetical protein
MRKAITHFDQIPISAVVEIMERQVQKKAIAMARDVQASSTGEPAGFDRGHSMKRHAAVDIFRLDPKGVLWLESSASVDEAKARIRQLAAQASEEYVILDQATGTKLVIKIDGVQTGNTFSETEEVAESLATHSCEGDE